MLAEWIRVAECPEKDQKTCNMTYVDGQIRNFFETVADSPDTLDMARRVRTILAAKSRTRSTSTWSDEYVTCAHRIDESTIGRTESEETSQQ